MLIEICLCLYLCRQGTKRCGLPRFCVQRYETFRTFCAILRKNLQVLTQYFYYIAKSTLKSPTMTIIAEKLCAATPHPLRDGVWTRLCRLQGKNILQGRGERMGYPTREGRTDGLSCRGGEQLRIVRCSMGYFLKWVHSSICES